MLNVFSDTSLRAKSLIYYVLDKSDIVNSIVNRITGGFLNRDSLAKSIYKSALNLFATSYRHKEFGLKLFNNEKDLSLNVINAFFSNKTETMKEGVEALINNIFNGLDESYQETYSGIAKKFAIDMTAFFAKNLVEKNFGNNAGEKLLNILAKNHGVDSAQLIIDSISNGKPKGKFSQNILKSVLNRAVVNNPKYDVSDNNEYILVADLINSALSGTGEYTKALDQYAAKSGYFYTAYKLIVPCFQWGWSTFVTG